MRERGSESEGGRQREIHTGIHIGRERGREREKEKVRREVKTVRDK